MAAESDLRHWKIFSSKRICRRVRLNVIYLSSSFIMSGARNKRDFIIYESRLQVLNELEIVKILIV